MFEKVESVEARHVVIPLDSPVWLGGYSVTIREYCFVEIVTSEGRKGHALTFTRGGDLASAVMNNVVPLIIGKNVSQIEAIWDEVYQKNRLIGQQGLLMRALSIIDIALWDLKAKKAQMPLHQVLGGHRESIPVLMAGGYYDANKDLDQLCEEFVGYIGEGYKHVKLMVGGATMEEDLNRFITLRAALPEHITLGIDVNGNWSDPKAVLRWIEKAQNKGGTISFIEEPFKPENVEAYSWICERTNVPVAFGEFIAGRWAFKEAICRQHVDVVRADSTLCGGITEWRRIAALVATWNKTMIPHYFASIHLHLALAFPNIEMIEVVSTVNKNSSFALLAGESYVLKDGIAYPKCLPGLGLTIDVDFMDFHTSFVLSSS